jgi:hypothetical protein
MSLTADFLIQAIIVFAFGCGFLWLGIRTLRSDSHHYMVVRRRTGDARRAVVGTVGHHTSDPDATTSHGMALGRRNGKRVIVRNGKIAADSISGV